MTRLASGYESSALSLSVGTAKVPRERRVARRRVSESCMLTVLGSISDDIDVGTWSCEE
jgi:hypothetical protein